MMIGDGHDLFYKFLKIKYTMFHVHVLEDEYEFIIDFHEWFHKMDMVEKYGVEFITFQL